MNLNQSLDYGLNGLTHSFTNPLHIGGSSLQLSSEPPSLQQPQIISQIPSSVDISKHPIVLNLQSQNQNLIQDSANLIKNYTQLQTHITTLQSRYNELEERYLALESSQSSQFEKHVAPWIKARHDTVAPSDSISQLTHLKSSISTPSNSTSGMTSSVSPTVEPPLIRPHGYPVEILWNFKDTWTDPDINISEDNKYRPCMRKCIRNKDGTFCSDDEWKNLRRLTTQVIRNKLLPLTKRRLMVGRKPAYTKIYFQSFFQKEWDDAVSNLEEREPLLQLCALHWKAEHTLARKLDSISRKEKGKAIRGDKNQDNMDSEDDSSGDNEAPIITKVAKRRTDDLPANAKKKKTTAHSSVVPTEHIYQVESEREHTSTRQFNSLSHKEKDKVTMGDKNDIQDDINSENNSSSEDIQHNEAPLDALIMKYHTGDLPANAKKTAIIPSGRRSGNDSAEISKVADNHISEGLTAPQIEGNKNDVTMIHGVTVSSMESISFIDISSLVVEPSFEVLQRIFSTDPIFQNIPNSLDLLAILEQQPTATPESQLSSKMHNFLIAIETADPNAPDFAEDNTNASWGHQQFRSGPLDFRNITWEDIGNRTIAYRVLAATIRTCQVSRHLCFKRKVKSLTYLADIYLQKIIENLWKHFQRQQESCPSEVATSTCTTERTELNASSSAPAVSSGLDPCEKNSQHQQSKLQSLYIPELKGLIEKYSVKTSVKKPNRAELLEALLPVGISNDEVDEILQLRKRTKQQKAAKSTQSL